MSLLEKITDALQASPGIKAKKLASALQEERGTINNLLHSNQDRFIQNDDFTWQLRPETPKAVPHRRPGPFGPARELLPEGQQIEVMSGDTPCHIALGRMMELNISTIPIRDERGHITGVFTWRAFSQRAHGLSQSTKIALGDLCDEVIENSKEDALFIQADEYIDTDLDWNKVEYVIVGSETEPLGILTIADIWGRLNDFAEAYVLIHEIEHDLRVLIRCVAGTEALLKKWISEVNQTERQQRSLTQLSDFQFNQYITLICNGQTRWPKFEQVFPMSKLAIFRAEFLHVNKTRNTVFHFKEPVTQSMCHHLRSFRDKIRSAVTACSRSD